MTEQTVAFPSGQVRYLFQGSFEELWKMYDRNNCVIITDEHLGKLYDKLFRGLKILVVPPSESAKNLDVVQTLAKELLGFEATRQTLFIGAGGGVVTDITGFLASVYMRGVKFGFVPTSLLAMVDAAIGGKNGVNIGMNKNVLGTVTQPEFILYDTTFLNSLPDDEWSNGFAEIIKYACIFDAALFDELSERTITFYKDENDHALDELIMRCVAWKNKTVAADEKETGDRKLLNFGHTAAHAIENLYELPHGKAVAIGMVIACMISCAASGLDKSVVDKLKKLLTEYHLPVHIQIDARKAMDILRMDKKRSDETIDYILLEKIGKAIVKPLPLAYIENALTAYEGNS